MSFSPLLNLQEEMRDNSLENGRLETLRLLDFFELNATREGVNKLYLVHHYFFYFGNEVFADRHFEWMHRDSYEEAEAYIQLFLTEQWLQGDLPYMWRENETNFSWNNLRNREKMKRFLLRHNYQATVAGLQQYIDSKKVLDNEGNVLFGMGTKESYVDDFVMVPGEDNEEGAWDYFEWWWTDHYFQFDDPEHNGYWIQIHKQKFIGQLYQNQYFIC